MSFFIKTRSELESMSDIQLGNVVHNFRDQCVRFRSWSYEHKKNIEYFSQDNQFYRIRIDDIPNYVFH